MIRGKGIELRTIRETDLDRLYTLLTDIANRGDFVPLQLPSEPVFKRQFRDTGFWNEDYERLLMVTPEDDIVGSIWCCKSIPYFDGLEITKIHRVQLIIADGNIASERVAQKCGFTYEGTVREAMFQRRMHRDMKLYSQLRDERDTGLPNRLFS